jgi:hypothetical protein
LEIEQANKQCHALKSEHQPLPGVDLPCTVRMALRSATDESELLRHALEHFLNGRRVSNESGRHLQSLRGNIAHGRLDVVRDPFNEVRRILVLHVEHLFVNFLSRHASAEHGGGSEVTSVTGVRSAHHVLKKGRNKKAKEHSASCDCAALKASVLPSLCDSDLGIEHLLSQLRNGQRAVLLRSARGQRSESDHEEVLREKYESNITEQINEHSDAATDLYDEQL